MRFYLDDDHSPRIAAIARRYGVDVISSRECGNVGKSDDHHLTYASSEGRAVVTRNYSDFASFTTEFQRLGRQHAGVIFVPPSLPGNQFDQIARALVAFDRAWPDGVPPYYIDWLHPPHD